MRAEVVPVDASPTQVSSANLAEKDLTLLALAQEPPMVDALVCSTLLRTATKRKLILQHPGIEPGPSRWKRDMQAVNNYVAFWIY